jgi:5-(carboxyamino)imidazole ribonucleotide mutase
VLLKRMQAFQTNLEQVVAEKDKALRARLLG